MYSTGPWVINAGEGALSGASLLWPTFVLAATAVSLLVCGVLSARGTLHPNPFVGVRTSFTMDSARNWYAVHERMAPSFTGVGLFYAIAIAPLFLFDAVGAQALTMAFFVLVGTGVAIGGTVRAQRAARRALAEEDAREDGICGGGEAGEERPEKGQDR